jgi:hypothetical protein
MTSRTRNCSIPLTLRGDSNVSAPTPAALLKSVEEGVFSAESHEKLKEKAPENQKRHPKDFF